ncbi:MAG: TonB-dependent receptor [Terricaulis sp.]
MSNKSKLGWLLLSSASLAAMGAMSPAFAQDEEISDEIVVTATGRSAAIQDVPIAVTAISGAALEQAGVRTLIDLRQVTPNLRIGSGQSQTSGTSASIRGIGTGSDNPGFEAAVGIFIDGVYRARTGTAINDLADVERIEILRGPQGTLYGKNTTAGAISVVTAGPDFETGAWLEGTGGELGLLGTQFGANFPIIEDVLALRFDGNLRTRDGYIDNVTDPSREVNTTDRWSGRLQALWDISADATLRVIVDAAETDEQCCAAVTLYDSSFSAPFFFSSSVNLTQTGSIATPLFTLANVAGNPEGRSTSLSSNRSYAEQSEDFGASAQLDWDVGGMNFTSITAFRDWESTRDQDIDFSRMDRAYRDDLEIGVQSFTQEFRLQGEAGRVNWLVGAFYGDETVEQTDNIRYGTQAGAYINNLLTLFDFSGAGELQDNNGPLPGTGNTVFGCTPGSPLVAATNCALDFVLGAFASQAGPLGANAAVPGTGAQIGARIGLFSGALSPVSLDGSGQQGDVWGIDTNSLALFTHNEINITDNMVLTLGARWTQEEKQLSADLNGSQPGCDVIRANQDAIYGALVIQRQADTFLPVGNALRTLADGLPGALTLICNPAVNNIQVLQNGGVYGGDTTDEAFSGTASMSYHVNDDVMIYGGYSRGYKSGGFNIDRSGMEVRPWSTTTPLSAYAQSAATYLGLPTNPTFGAANLDFLPETIDALELGFKSTVFGSTTLNVAAFYQQLHDYQLNAFNGFNFITRNVPEVVSQGVELEATIRPMDDLTLTFGTLYSDVYYDSTVAFGPNPSDVVNSGDPLSQSPEWTVTGSLLYQVPISEGMQLSFYGNGRWVSDYRLQTLSRNPNTDQASFAIFDARVGIGARDDRWGLDVWVRNLADEYYSIGAFAVPEQSLFSASGRVEGVFAAYPNEPRTMGVTLRARY